MGCSTNKSADEKENKPRKNEDNQNKNKKEEDLKKEEELKAQQLKEQNEKENQEKERLEQEQKERERLEQEQKEKERLEQEQKEKERLEQEQKEKERLEQEQKEKERLEQEQKEKERLEQKEKERLEQEQKEKERQEQEQKEKERLEQEQKEKEKNKTNPDEETGEEEESHNNTIPPDPGHYLGISLKNKKNKVFVPTKEDLERFQRDGLKRHNYYRKYHQVGPLELTQKLNEYAQKYAETLAAKNKMQHSTHDAREKIYGDWTGENLYYFWTSSSNVTINGAAAVDSWYDEIKDYDFSKGDSKNGGVVGHFTQLVWKGTSQLGMGVARSSQNSVFVVANYHFGGNFNKAEKTNVFPAQVKT